MTGCTFDCMRLQCPLVTYSDSRPTGTIHRELNDWVHFLLCALAVSSSLVTYSDSRTTGTIHRELNDWVYFLLCALAVSSGDL